MIATVKQFVTDNIIPSGWLICAPLLAAYAPRDLPKMCFNLHLRRYARRLVPFLDPFVTIDIVSKSSRSGESNDAYYKEVKAYLSNECSRDALEFCVEGAVDDRTLLLSLVEGQEVTDHFQGTTVWWLLMPRTSKTLLESRESCLRLMFPHKKWELILNDYLPHVRRTGRGLMFITIDVVKKSGLFEKDLKSSDAFEEVKAYLSSACSTNVLRLRAEGTAKDDSFLLSLRKGHEVADHFQGIALWWSLVPTGRASKSCLRLRFPQQHRRLILDEYLPHIRREGRNLLFGTRSQRLYTNKRGRSSYGSDEVWNHIEFKHPSTFDTLAMHPTKKRRMMEDLDSFRRNKEYYCRIGKPWKRGYLLYGPPGTGKSSMIAAMANYLNYSIYDIELTTVPSNSDLRKLFIEMKSKSIIVIEDIDCCVDDFTGERDHQRHCQKRISSCSDDDDDNSIKVTLSGLLNFIDGVWSAQTGEQIIVLTSNFPDKLDPALLRRGRMDMHVEMSYCCFEAFKTLAKNYLGVEAHPLFVRVEELLQVVEITPADVAECLLPSQPDVLGSNDRGVETCLGRLIVELKKRFEEKKAKRKVEAKAAAKPKRRRRRY